MIKTRWFKALIIILIVLILAAVAIFVAKILKNKDGKIVETLGVLTEEEQPEEKKVQIYSGDKRPIAVMIDNVKEAWPQASINDAYIVYEIIVEGGETRLMALFKNSDADVIGPIRSSRHYFLDYALENDAIYAHIGWSPQAQRDISTLGVNNINGLYYDSGRARTDDAKYWRDTKRAAPHNCFSCISKLYEVAQSLGYRTTSTSESVLNYSADEIELQSETVANKVTIPYSSYTTVKFEYNAETKRYTKYAKNTKQTDARTGEDITTKNIIITFAGNYTLTDAENKGRQGLKNIGTLDGYYITNGKSIPIKCIKNARNSQTVYQDLEGNEIKVNDGNTFIQICPLNAKVVIE